MKNFTYLRLITLLVLVLAYNHLYPQSGNNIISKLGQPPSAIKLSDPVSTEQQRIVKHIIPTPLANKVKYVVVKDFDVYADSAYWLSIQKYMPEYVNNAQFVSWSNLTGGSINMNDLQVVIVPMGSRPLTKPIVTVLENLLSKNKEVILTGFAIIYYAFNPASSFKDPDVTAFLQNYCGVSYPVTVKVSSRNGNTITWWSFNIHGEFGDPIGGSIRKFCNEGFNTGTEIWQPLSTEFQVDAFQSSDSSKFFPVDHFKRGDNDPRTDTIVATRTIIGDSAHLVFYSIGFDAFAGEIPRATLLERCITWCIEWLPLDGPIVNVSPPNIDYGYVSVDSSVTNDITVKNIGNQPLVIHEISFWDDGNGTFTCTKGCFKQNNKDSITLKTGETYQFTIQFTPTATGADSGIVTVISNSKVNSYQDITLKGIGGHEITGPKIASDFPSDTINFDTLNTSNKTFDLNFHNSGESDLYIDVLDISQNDDGVFSFPQTINLPITIKGNDSLHTPLKIRFSSRQALRTYNGQIHVHSNATNIPDYYLALTGVMGEQKGVKEGEKISNDGLFDMSVTPNPLDENSKLRYTLIGSQTRSLKIIITDINGNEVLNLPSVDIVPGDYELNIGKLAISPGAYVIMATIGGETLCLPIILVK